MCNSFKNVCIYVCIYLVPSIKLGPALVLGHMRTWGKYWEKGKFWKPFFHSSYFRNPRFVAIKLRAVVWLSQSASSTLTPGLCLLPVLTLLLVTEETHRRIIFCVCGENCRVYIGPEWEQQEASCTSPSSAIVWRLFFLTARWTANFVFNYLNKMTYIVLPFLRPPSEIPSCL